MGLSLDPNAKKMVKTDFLIIGGGVAGLSAANHLVDQGASVTLLDAGSYPSHKICGEFLSPEALPILEKWKITPARSIEKIKIITPKREWSNPLPKNAATLMRYTLDHALAKRAEKKGAIIQTSAFVETIKNSVVTLASGEQYESKAHLISTGRLLNKKTPQFSYIGIKAHFKGIDLHNELLMHLLPNAYFGMAPIGNSRVNIAGIIACTHNQALNPKETLSAFFKQPHTHKLTKLLEKGNCLFDDWLMGPIPQFGIRKHTPRPNTFFLGDAAGVIPPASGNGLAMGLTSGILAAEYALKNQPEAYLHRWNQEYKKRISKGQFLNRLFLSPYLQNAIPQVNRLIPSLPRYFFYATRGGL
ncbi:NAD(P)/FAD-dependent oxidoreductase [Chlamydiales bacterium]|nr:NAD(P)/FAD-dependent oxidoreductase [Chlamydiales bacterium]